MQKNNCQSNVGSEAGCDVGSKVMVIIARDDRDLIAAAAEEEEVRDNVTSEYVMIVTPRMTPQ